MTNPNTARAVTIETGINGSGAKVWIVVKEWVRAADGRKMAHADRFDNEPEAAIWVKWS